jgi:hypothetical protein
MRSPSSLRVCVRIVATQRLCKKVAAATNKHGAVEELLDASFSMLSL